MNNIDHLINSFQLLIDPINFIDVFESMDDFEEWCNLGSITDLQCTLKRFDSSELYEHCIIIKKVIKEKENGTK